MKGSRRGGAAVARTNRDAELRKRLRTGPTRPLHGKLLRMVKRHAHHPGTQGRRLDWTLDADPQVDIPTA